jgi:hypothetical protein
VKKDRVVKCKTKEGVLGMRKVISGLVYDTERALCVAHDHYWDGRNFTRHGRNVFLYKTPKGRFFLHHTSCWQGEFETIEPIAKEEVKEWYESLPCHEVPYEDAFEEVPEEA